MYAKKRLFFSKQSLLRKERDSLTCIPVAPAGPQQIMTRIVAIALSIVFYGNTSLSKLMLYCRKKQLVGINPNQS